MIYDPSDQNEEVAGVPISPMNENSFISKNDSAYLSKSDSALPRSDT